MQTATVTTTATATTTAAMAATTGSVRSACSTASAVELHGWRGRHHGHPGRSVDCVWPESESLSAQFRSLLRSVSGRALERGSRRTMHAAEVLADLVGAGLRGLGVHAWSVRCKLPGHRRLHHPRASQPESPAAARGRVSGGRPVAVAVARQRSSGPCDGQWRWEREFLGSSSV